MGENNLTPEVTRAVIKTEARKPQATTSTEVSGWINEFLRADKESDGRFLISIPKKDGTNIQLLRLSETSIDKQPRTIFWI